MTTSAGAAADALTADRDASSCGNRLVVERGAIQSGGTGRCRAFRSGHGVYHAHITTAEGPDVVGGDASGGDEGHGDGDYVAFYRQHGHDDDHSDPEAGKRAASPSGRPTSGTVGAEASTGLYGIAVGAGVTGIAGSTLTIVDAEAITGRSFGRACAQPGRIGANTSTPTIDYVTLSLDRSVVAAILPHARRLHGTLLPRKLSALLGEAVLTLARGTAAQAAPGFTIAALLAEASDDARPPSEPAASETLASKRFRTRLFIDAHIRRKDLDVNAIARGVGMSRSSLYRTFESVGGIEREIIRRRIARLRSAVLHPGEARSIATLVSDLGFASAAHASRVFTAAYGMAPGRFRAELRKVQRASGACPSAARQRR